MRHQSLRKWLPALAALALTVAFVLTGCASSSEKSEIVIGAAFPVTGPYAMSGQYYVNAVQIAQDDVNAAGGINGKKLRIVIEDTTDSNSVAVNAFTKLVKEQNPPFIFLSSYSPMNMATAPEVTKAKIPVMYGGGATAVADLKNPWMFRIRPEDSLRALAMVQHSVDTMKKTKLGILYVQSDFGQGAMKDSVAEAQRRGATVVATEAYGVNDKDMSAQLLNLKNKGAEVILGFENPADGALIMRQIKQLGIDIPYFVSIGAYLPSALALVTESDLANTLGLMDSFPPNSSNPKAMDYVKRYKERFKADTDYAIGPPYYDGVMMVAEAMRKVGTDPTKLRDYFAGIQNYEGITHLYSFDERQNGVHDVNVVKIKTGTKDYEWLSFVQVKK